MTEKKGLLVHTVNIPIRWCDMDAFNHVNNSVYLSYFEIARLSWWSSIKPEDVIFDKTGPVIVNAHCQFLKAITYPETVSVKLSVGPAGRSSHECYYEIYSTNQPEQLYADGSTKVVWIDRELERSIPLPDYIKRHLPASEWNNL